MSDAPRFVTVDDYETLAREVLPPPTSEFVAGGAGDERTLVWNRRAFDRWAGRSTSRDLQAMRDHEA